MCWESHFQVTLLYCNCSKDDFRFPTRASLLVSSIDFWYIFIFSSRFVWDAWSGMGLLGGSALPSQLWSGLWKSISSLSVDRPWSEIECRVSKWRGVGNGGSGRRKMALESAGPADRKDALWLVRFDWFQVRTFREENSGLDYTKLVNGAFLDDVLSRM